MVLVKFLNSQLRMVHSEYNIFTNQGKPRAQRKIDPKLYHSSVSVKKSGRTKFLRCYPNELGRTAINMKGAWPEEPIHVKYCGQDLVRRSQGALCE